MELKMKNIYLYGASDDCHEIEGDFGEFESYGDIEITFSREEWECKVVAKYTFDGDWGIEIVGELPAAPAPVIFHGIRGNEATATRNIKQAGAVIHLQVPDVLAV